jgi:hypothetical protein
MNTYQFRTPRLGVGIAALAMSALTFGLMVVLPSHLERDSGIHEMFAASSDVARSCAAMPVTASDNSE